MLEVMQFSASYYGAEVASILGLDGAGLRPMPLAPSGCSSTEARTELNRHKARDLFPHAVSSEGALAALYLCFWHAIMHRQEPDAANAAYWFRQVGRHPIFSDLGIEAQKAGFDTSADWDPFAFIDFCEAARATPGSQEEDLARKLQLIEWQLLFDYCAREKASH